jgi:hypothetical protein
MVRVEAVKDRLCVTGLQRELSAFLRTSPVPLSRMKGSFTDGLEQPPDMFDTRRTVAYAVP